MKNGSLFKSPDGKVVVLQELTASLFCLFEIDSGAQALNIVTGKDGKWQYSEEELTETLAGFEPVPGHLALSQTKPEPKPEPLPEPEPEPFFAPTRKTRK